MAVLNWIQLGLRIWEFIFSALVMGIIGSMMQKDPGSNPAAVNYAMFAAAFSILFLFYLFPASINTDWAGSVWIMIVLDVLNAIWFLTSGIVLAARSQAHSCTDWSFLISNEITQSVDDKEKLCREGQVSTAFLWFAWAGYTASVFVSLIQARRSTGGLGGGRAGRQKPARPMMTQA